MSAGITLREYEDNSVVLDPDDVTFITEQLRGRITIRRALHGSDYELNPNQYVGVVVLPSGQRLESYPKVPVRSLFYMLAVAFNLPSPFLEEWSEFDELDEMLEFVVAHYADLLDSHIVHGLYRAYAEREENLTAVRGRIAVADDVRHNFVLRHRTYCRFAEFTWDVPENQILRQVAHLVAGWVRKPQLRMQLRRIDRLMGEVAPTNLPASVLDGFTYHRLNDDYEPMHRLCRLFLEGASLSEAEGSFVFRTFLLDMNRLFEAFVTQLLRDRAPSGIAVDAQVPVYLGDGKKVRMQPDIVIRDRGVPRLVADCKYKRLEPDEFRHHDVYQVLAYCTAINVEQGLLVYPMHEVTVRDEVSIRHAPVIVRQTSLDLSGTGEELDMACEAFAREVFFTGGVLGHRSQPGNATT
jgi:5-methylcytosine-specific restriction enzyme subunit McrC